MRNCTGSGRDEVADTDCTCGTGHAPSCLSSSVLISTSTRVRCLPGTFPTEEADRRRKAEEQENNKGVGVGDFSPD